MPLDLVMGSPEEQSNVNQNIDQYVQQMQTDAEKSYSIAREQLQACAEKRKIMYDMKVKN